MTKKDEYSLIVDPNKIERASVILGDIYTQIHFVMGQFKKNPSEYLKHCREDKFNGHHFGKIYICKYIKDMSYFKFFICYGTWIIIFKISGYGYFDSEDTTSYFDISFQELKSNVITHYDIFFHFSNIGFKRMLK
jgi:hypothetical protein